MIRTRILKNSILGGVLIICLLFGGCSKDNAITSSMQGEWKPNKNITIICGYGVGGSTDIFARTLAKHLSNYWGVDVTVKNIQGASGATATSKFYKTSPDGYTVLVSNGATITQSAFGNVEWTYNDFTNIAKIIDEDEILCVKANSNISNLHELIDKCKRNEGQVSIGVAGAGGYTYLAAIKLIKDLDLNVKIITYDSGAEAVNAVVGGFVDFCMQQPAEVISGIESGKLHALAIMSEERHNHPKLAHIPTAKEQHVNFVSYQWRGISAPANLPQDERLAWEVALKYICEQDEFKSEVNNILLARENIIVGDSMQDFLDKEYSWIKPLVKSIGLEHHD